MGLCRCALAHLLVCGMDQEIGLGFGIDRLEVAKGSHIAEARRFKQSPHIRLAQWEHVEVIGRSAGKLVPEAGDARVHIDWTRANVLAAIVELMPRLDAMIE